MRASRIDGVREGHGAAAMWRPTSGAAATATAAAGDATATTGVARGADARRGHRVDAAGASAERVAALTARADPAGHGRARSRRRAEPDPDAAARRPGPLGRSGLRAGVPGADVPPRRAAVEHPAEDAVEIADRHADLLHRVTLPDRHLAVACLPLL